MKLLLMWKLEMESHPWTAVSKVKIWNIKDSCVVYVPAALIQGYTYSMELGENNILQTKSIHAYQ
jgi:hypothetical protein